MPIDTDLIQRCARHTAAALCDSIFSTRDDAWEDMYETVMPFVAASIVTYLEMLPVPTIAG